MNKSGGAGLVVATIAAIALAAFGMIRGTWSVGGSDSSCYALSALAMARGQLQPSSALAVEAPWPNAPLTQAPGGFIPSPVRPDAASPICAPGMAVLMAPFAAIFGRDAIFVLVPLSGGLLVLAAFALGQRLAGAAAGALSAVLVASSPIVLYQVVQPMNDVLTAALWMSAFAFIVYRRGTPAGLLAGLAVLVRPNLAPLLAVVALIPMVVRQDRAARTIALTLAAAVPGIGVMLYLNNALYGSVVASGYGDATQLFSPGNVGENAANFSRALSETHTIVPAIALVAPLLLTGDARRLSCALLAAAAVVAGIYLLYRPYPEWWYLRFLMTAIVLLLILASAVLAQAASRWRMGGVLPIAAVVLAISGLRAAGEHQVFELQRLEGRYRETARVVDDRLPPNAVVITVWQSGSVRFHADRDAVMWDALDPAWLDGAVAWLSSRGLRPYLLFERREENEFRARFEGRSELGALDWPPRFDMNRQVRIYDPADRARYLAGDDYATDNIRPR